MATTEHIYQRLTYKYRDSYRNLDKHEFLGSVKALPPKLVRPARDDDFSDGGDYVFRVAVPRDVFERHDLVTLRQAISNHFTQSHCRHEWDCCGCRSTYAHARHVPGTREFRVNYGVRFNY